MSSNPSSFPKGPTFTEISEGCDCSMCILPKQVKVLTNPCHHKFHKTCLEKWMAGSDKCPACQIELGILWPSPQWYLPQERIADMIDINNLLDNIGNVFLKQIYANSGQDPISQAPSPPPQPPPQTPGRISKRSRKWQEARMTPLPDNDGDQF